MIWEIDSTHSQVSFAIRVMSVTTTRGSFNTLRGQVHIDEQSPASSCAFFAVKKYPTIAFRSTQVEHIGGSAYKVTGNLTLLGTTKPIAFEVAYSGQSAELNARTGLTARATIDRDDFGLGRGTMVQSAAGKTATVEIALVAVQKDEGGSR